MEEFLYCPSRMINNDFGGITLPSYYNQSKYSFTYAFFPFTQFSQFYMMTMFCKEAYAVRVQQNNCPPHVTRDTLHKPAC